MKRTFLAASFLGLALVLMGASLALAAPKPKPVKKPIAPAVEASEAASFKPSRFAGVRVRHIPAPPSRRLAQRKLHRGLILGKPRPIPGHKGFTVDVDPLSFPSESVQVPPLPRAAKKLPSVNPVR